MNGPRLPAVKALLFDLDGTLADTAAANVTAYAMALAENGISVDVTVLARVSHGRNWRQFLPPLIRAAGSAVEPALVAERKKALYRDAVVTVRLNTALLAVLRASRPALRTALVTTASRANVDALLTAHGLRSDFDVIVTGDDVTAHKPHPEAYSMALEQLGLAPHEAVAFEDSDIGAASAQAAGVLSIRVVL